MAALVLRSGPHYKFVEHGLRSVMVAYRFVVEPFFLWRERCVVGAPGIRQLLEDSVIAAVRVI
jgi:hypothetical protein